jgi:hypothetical protein
MIVTNVAVVPLITLNSSLISVPAGTTSGTYTRNPGGHK